MTWSVPRWLRRAALFVPALGCALLAVVFAGAGASSRALACDRAAGRCTWTTGGWPAGDERTFAIASVREVRLVEGLGKHGRQAETALVFASGHELRLARADAGARGLASPACTASSPGRARRSATTARRGAGCTWSPPRPRSPP